MTSHTPRNGPDFICIGMQKAGTGWLYDQLCAHQQVTMPPIKEIHFFDRGFHFQKTRIRFREAINRAINEGHQAVPADLHFFKTALLQGQAFQRERRSTRLVRERDSARPGQSLTYLHLNKADMDWYCSLFNGPGVAFSGDITPGYGTLPDDLIQQIFETLPMLKIILLVRHPVDRLWSQILMMHRSGRLDKKSLSNPDLVADLLEQPMIKARSFPCDIAERWRKHFSQEQIGIFAFDKLKSDPEGLREDILTFLELDPDLITVDPTINRKASRKKLSMTTAVRDRLSMELSAEIAKSRYMLGSVASTW